MLAGWRSIVRSVRWTILTGAAWQWPPAKNKLLNTIAALDPNPATSATPTPRSATRTSLIVGVDSRIGPTPNGRR